MKKTFVCLLSLICIVISCSEDSQPEIPKVTTANVEGITQTSATSGGSVVSDGGSPITQRGVCWSTNSTPTTSDSKTQDGAGSGYYVSNLTGLSIGTTYYARAYATNAAGTGYGEAVSFTTSGPSVPALTTSNATNITINSAAFAGTVTADGGAPVTERGFCWSTNPEPTIADNKTTSGAGSGAFAGAATNLSAGTTYFVRAFATNSAGTSYGNVVSFTTALQDIDGNVYKTVHVGTQVWMAENLKTTRYANGDAIATTTPVTLDITSLPSPKYQWSYNGLEINAAVYGRLYTWYAATDSRKLCPAGWHLPSVDEWTTMRVAAGVTTSGGGGNLKETGTTHWNSPNTGATNASGFNALPAGQRSMNGTFESLGMKARWWTSIETVELSAADRNLSHDNEYFYMDVLRKSTGLSVRCLKD